MWRSFHRLARSHFGSRAPRMGEASWSAPPRSCLRIEERKIDMARHEPVIIGVADEPLKNGVAARPGSALQIQARCAKAALGQAGLHLGDVDVLFTAGLWGIPGAGQLATITLSEYLNIRPMLHDGTNIGGSA